MSEWAISSDEESNWQGGLATREEAIAEGTACYEGAPFFIGETSPLPSVASIFSWQDVCERADEALSDIICFEDPVYDPTEAQGRELEAELQAVFDKWCERCGIVGGRWYVPKHERITPLAESQP